MNQELIKDLETKAKNIRRDIISMIGEAGSGHPGGSLSGADIVAALYFHVLKIDPKKPDWAERDRFVLSKGHAAPLLYAALAEKGYFPKEDLLTLRKLGSKLQGHPDLRKVPGVEMSTGSLGQGFSAAVGMALAAKLDRKSSKVYVLLGDGETQEGIVWEAAMAAAHYKLNNLIAFVDHNGLQIDGFCEDIMGVDPMHEKWQSFGWYVLNIDGHNMEEIIHAVREAQQVQVKPVAIIAKTVKGKGVSFMENQVGWHGVAPKPEEIQKALQELS
ncbi:transketolase [Bacillota bacterium LX-D]|nr:transketolase [Bacillota bacterium LX-D]